MASPFHLVNAVDVVICAALLFVVYFSAYADCLQRLPDKSPSFYRSIFSLFNIKKQANTIGLIVPLAMMVLQLCGYETVIFFPMFLVYLQGLS